MTHNSARAKPAPRRLHGPRALVALCLFVAACAHPTTDYPRIGEEEEAAARDTLLGEVIDIRLEQQARLASLAWPVMTANMSLCGKKTRHALGWMYGDDKDIAKSIGQMRAVHVREAAGIDALTVLHVVPGGPADKAGIVKGDRLVAFEDVTLPSYRAVRAAGAKLEDGEAISVTLANGEGAQRTVSITPEKICSARIRLDPTASYSAYTNGTSIWVSRGMIRDLEDDRMIQFVLAHELGHVVARHWGKTQRNVIVSGGFVLIPVAGVLALVTDLFVGLIGGDPVPAPGADAATAFAASLTRSPQFEREADYLGLYLFARVNPDLEDMEAIFEALAAESPLRVWRARTHPELSERIVAIDRTRDEIAAKLAAGTPLVPNGFTPP